MTTPNHAHDAFGRLLIDPAKLTRRERVEALRTFSGELQASHDLVARWLGRALGAWFRCGGDLERALDIRPPRGSRTRAETMVRRAIVEADLAKLVCALGAARASRVLRGSEPIPVGLVELVERLRDQHAPTSEAAMRRARKRTRDRR